MQEQLPSDSVTQHLLLRCVGLRLSPNPTYGPGVNHHDRTNFSPEEKWQKNGARSCNHPFGLTLRSTGARL